jgi:hypothetical protein
VHLIRNVVEPFSWSHRCGQGSGVIAYGIQFSPK